MIAATAAIQLDQFGALAQITIANPARRNALTMSMWDDLAEAVKEASSHSSTRMITIRGAGNHFSAGIDLQDVSASRWGGACWSVESITSGAHQALIAAPIPVIALVQGSCVGAGVLIATACDLRLCSSDAVFGITPAKLGLVYPAIAVSRLTQLIGPARAKSLLFTGDLINAHHARRIGLVDEVFSATELQSCFESFVARMSANSLLSQVSAKQMIEQEQAGHDVRKLGASWERESWESGEVQVGLSSFLQRQRPDFPWRVGDSLLAQPMPSGN